MKPIGAEKQRQNKGVKEGRTIKNQTEKGEMQ
jgi:hypothetical protein